MINNPYVPETIGKFENSNEFSYLAEYFNKHEVYCHIPERTQKYIEFWKDVKDKCINGFTNSKGFRITGDHFFYLNFCKILAEVEEEGSKRKRKIEFFPRFVDLDYEYFWMIDYCKNNQKCLIALKARRQGWSYKGAAVVAKEYTFLKDSRNIIGAFLSAYSDQTMGMVKEYINHISTYTPFAHIRNPDLTDYFKSQYQSDVGGVNIWKGYKSSVESITFKDKPAALAGKSASILLLDEAGLFPNIITSWGFTEPILKNGSNFTGLALIYGSAGEMESGTKFFYDMYINPGQYGMLEFDDGQDTGKKVGYFSSATKGRWGLCLNPQSKWFNKLMIDADGNSNEEAAFDDLMYLREISKASSNPKTLHMTISQFPVKWQEGFMRNKGAIFASPELMEWLGEIETTEVRNEVQKGELVYREGKYEFKPNPDLNYITSFPLTTDEDNRGCIAIWEHPEEISGEIPYGLYIGGCDPIDMDKSGTNSLGSFYIYKRFYSADKTHDLIVAEYTGRPPFTDDWYEGCRRLCIYYNAKVLYENMLKGFKGYFEQKNSLHYLYEQPAIIRDIVKDSKVQRGYGIHMSRGSNGSSGIKDTCELYLRDWLYTEREDINGKKIMNFHTIKSIALLKELIAYDIEGNYDRCISFMLCILQTKDLHRQHVQDMSSSSKAFSNDNFMKRTWENRTIQKVNNFTFSH